MFNSRFAVEIVTAVFTAVVGAVVCFGSLQHGIAWGEQGPAAGFFPFYIGCLIMLGSFATLIQVILARHELTGEFIAPERIKDVVIFSGAILAFVILLVLLGLYVSTAIYLFVVLWRKAKLRPLTAAAVGVGTAIFFFVCFEYAFQLPLPKGPLLGFFGIF